MGTRRTVRTDDGALLTLVLDGADPREAEVTVVLAHGWTLTHHSFDDVVDRLLEQHPGLAVVRWDQRDHGRSTTGRAGLAPSVRRLGDDLATVLAASRPAGALVLGGHSMGAMTIMHLALSYPDLFGPQVKGVALFSTSAGEMADYSPVRAIPGRVFSRVAPPLLAGLNRVPELVQRGRQAGSDLGYVVTDSTGPLWPEAVDRLRANDHCLWVRTW